MEENLQPIEKVSERSDAVGTVESAETVEHIEMQENNEVLEAEMEKDCKRRERKKFWMGVCVGIIGACAGIVIFILIQGIFLLKSDKIQYTGSVNTTEKDASKNESIVTSQTTLKMATIEKMINRYYYEDVDAKKLEDGVYQGMLESLGDPYSVYYTEEELEEVKNDTQGIYYGIGAYITLDTKTAMPIISGTISGTPAEEAGLQADDIIYKVDGTDATGMSTSEVVKLIKGEEHTFVTLTLIREGETIDVEVERRKIESPTVTSEMFDGDIGYIQITEFDDVTTDQFTEAMAVLRGQGMKGLIIDLRSNGGGNLTTCCDIARQLLPKGLIVYTETKNGEREEFTCDGKKEINIPLVVLVNEYSASASEILTGAIKDYGIGTIMGTTTYGKGIVQQIMSLRDGTAMKVTVSKYYTPNGHYIHGVGIDPDIVVEFDSDAYKEDKTDNQLNAAKEQIVKMIK